MKSKATITGAQLISILIIIRIAFGLNFFAGLKAGTSIQDVILAIPVIFLINLIIALPIFMLLKRHPGKDLIECAVQIFGKGLGFIVSLFYYCFFVYISSLQLGTFEMYYTSSVIQTDLLAIAIPILIVGIYGAIKGIESISRLGVFVLIFYLMVIAIIAFSLFTNIQLNYLKPLLFEGPNYFFKAVLIGVNSSFQILLIAMCVPFLKTEKKLFKYYLTWDALSMLILCFLLFLAITNLGPFVSKQLFPMITLSIVSKIDVFERIDAFNMIAWILNSTLYICVGIFVASQCLIRTALKKWRRIIITITAVIVFFGGSFISGIYLKTLNFYGNIPFTCVIIFLIMLLPLIILFTDTVKGKVAEDEGIV